MLEREVRANLVYRDFTRVGGAKMPDAKTMGRWGLAVEPAAIKQIHERMVKIAQDNGVTEGRRMRVDTTVVETNIHYPTERPACSATRILTARSAASNCARASRRSSADPITAAPAAAPIAW